MGYFFCEPTKHSLCVTRKAHLEVSGRIADHVGNIPLNVPSENPCLIAEMIELTSVPLPFTESNSEVCAFLHVLEGTVHSLRMV
jgi:hypothetical protein